MLRGGSQGAFDSADIFISLLHDFFEKGHRQPDMFLTVIFHLKTELIVKAFSSII